MKAIWATVLVFILAFGAVTLVADSTVLAQAGDAQRGVNAVGGGSALSFDNAIKTIVNTFLFLIGAVSVVMIIYGGFRYATSAGDTAAVASAKNTILYAVIGLVVALVAYAIVSFVIDAVEGSGDPAAAGNQTGSAAREAAEGATGSNNTSTPPATIGPTP